MAIAEPRAREGMPACRRSESANGDTPLGGTDARLLDNQRGRFVTKSSLLKVLGVQRN